jgi:hypothetical protein
LTDAILYNRIFAFSALVVVDGAGVSSVSYEIVYGRARADEEKYETDAAERDDG